MRPVSHASNTTRGSDDVPGVQHMSANATCAAREPCATCMRVQARTHRPHVAPCTCQGRRTARRASRRALVPKLTDPRAREGGLQLFPRSSWPEAPTIGRYRHASPLPNAHIAGNRRHAIASAGRCGAHGHRRRLPRTRPRRSAATGQGSCSTARAAAHITALHHATSHRTAPHCAQRPAAQRQPLAIPLPRR